MKQELILSNNLKQRWSKYQISMDYLITIERPLLCMIM